MTMGIEEQLEAYTTWKTRELFVKHCITIAPNELFTTDHHDVRGLFTFTRMQLISYLQERPELLSSYFELSSQMKGTYDRDILERDKSKYILYWQDHGSRRNEKLYDDPFEAAADWLNLQYGRGLAG